MTTTLVREHALVTAHGTFSTRLYRNLRGTVGLALWMGDIDESEVLSCRLHSSCFTSEGLGGLDCDCVSQLDAALGAIAETGRGLVFYLLQEGRGAGLRAKIRDREIVQSSDGAIDTFGAYAQLGLASDPRTYSLVPAICADLRLPTTLRLMTNNPAKIAALAAAGIDVERVEHALPASSFNAAYLTSKAKHGHALPATETTRARAPAALEALDPELPKVGRFTRVASYSLPIQVRNRPVWFRATAYTEPESGHDRIVLGCREPRAEGHELRHVFREQLYERFHASHAQQCYRASLERIVDRGAGHVLAIPADPELLSPHAGPTEAEDRTLLDAHSGALGPCTWEYA